MPRNRVCRSGLAAAAAAITAAGLAIRFSPFLPEWLRDAGGGAVYVCLVAVAVRFVKPSLDASRTAWLALGLTIAVEFAQLVRTPAAIAMRSTLLGRLVLGSTFSWLDFPPYVLGAGLAYAVFRRVENASGCDRGSTRLH